MLLPLPWKIRRELRRAYAKVQVAIWRRQGRESIEYCGLTIPFNRTGMNDGVVMALARRIYEAPEIRGLEIALCAGDRVMELGSGLGIVTALAARAVGPSGVVLSFEANPDMIPATRSFLLDHGVANVEIRHAVLVPDGATGSSREFFLTGSFASSSLLDTDNQRRKGVISVPAMSLGEVVSSFRPDVLICDIEGGEAELIPDLDASTLRAVVLELHPDRLSSEQIGAIDFALARYGLLPAPVALGGTVVLYQRTLPT